MGEFGWPPGKDLAPVLLAATVPSVVVVHPQLPVKSMAELGAYLKANKGTVNYASAGNGTPSHLGMEYYKRQNGFDPVHVPYKGGAPALQEMMGGQVQVMMALVPEAMPIVKSGKLRALAVTTARRSSALPDVPTLDEAGLKGFNIGTWFGVLAPAAVPKDILVRLNTEMVKAIQSPEFRKRMDEIGAEPIGNSAEQMAAQVKAETEKFAKLVKDAKVTIE